MEGKMQQTNYRKNPSQLKASTTILNVLVSYVGSTSLSVPFLGHLTCPWPWWDIATCVLVYKASPTAGCTRVTGSLTAESWREESLKPVLLSESDTGNRTNSRALVSDSTFLIWCTERAHIKYFVSKFSKLSKLTNFIKKNEGYILFDRVILPSANTCAIVSCIV